MAGARQWLATICACLLGASAYLYQQTPNPSAEPRSQDGPAASEHLDLFAWSHKIQDWTLRRLAASVVIGETPAQVQAQVHVQGEPGVRDDAKLCVWPDEEPDCHQGDRIVNQLLLDARPGASTGPIIKVAVANEYAQAEDEQAITGCNPNCRLTHNYYEADAIVFRGADVGPLRKWPNLTEAHIRRHQTWIAHLLESPPNTFDRRFVRVNRDGRHKFNWTAAYRSDADLVTPYAKFVPTEDTLDELLVLKTEADELFAQLNKTRSTTASTQVSETKLTPRPNSNIKVAWLISNCHARNKRLEYARELAQYVQVDIYGKCGDLICPKWSHEECLRHLRKNYKFYLAFENSNQREYITEKFYQNALGYNDPLHKLLPIVMGAPRDDYERLAPPYSFVHVDDFESPKQLASYLEELDADEALYSRYFKWKTLGRFVDTNFLCRVCNMLQVSREQNRVKSYDDLISWWLND